MAIEDDKKNINEVSYLSRDFLSFRGSLLDHARLLYPDKINDFTEAGLGGLFLDMASYIGDNLSFYLDHQFSELDIESAKEIKNIQRLAKRAGVQIPGAAASVVEVAFYFTVPSKRSVINPVEFVPDDNYIPVIKRGTKVTSDNGISFELVEDIIATKKDVSGNLIADYIAVDGDLDPEGNPRSFVVKVYGQCLSGGLVSEDFSIDDTFVPFRRITLSKENITEIISVRDSSGREYYNVESLSQDFVYKRVDNTSPDLDLVRETLELIPAPRRFTSEIDLDTGFTILTFGSGDAFTIDEDRLPDPSDVAIPLYGKKVFSKFSIDPNDLLKSKSQGISPRNTVITVTYRSGGGLNNNVPVGAISSVSSLETTFNAGISNTSKAIIRNSFEVENEKQARGGEDAPTIDEIKEIVLNARNAQSRIVSREDLIARIYTMPSGLGRVFRIGVQKNPRNIFATSIYMISRDSESRLINSPDTLKKNVKTYLNSLRLISDGVDILDAPIVNLRFEYYFSPDPFTNPSTIILEVNRKLREFLDIRNMQIDKPIVVSEIIGIIQTTRGVMSVDTSRTKITNLFSNFEGREYSSQIFNVVANTRNNIIFPPMGGIFEFRYLSNDIVGNVI